MRALVLFAVVAFLAWRLRRWLRRRTLDTHVSAASPTAMLACSHCGLHVPSSDALAGSRGHYCCADHRAAAEG